MRNAVIFIKMFSVGVLSVISNASAQNVQNAYLKAGRPGEDDRFGASVAISGDIAVVGEPYEDSSSIGVNSTPDESSSSAGAAWVFARNRITGAWERQAYLKPGNVSAASLFGTSVAVSGEVIVVGAPQEDSAAENSGAVYVFIRRDGVWIQEAMLKASNPRVLADFGSSVSISGDTIVVGSYRESGGSTGVNGPQGDAGQTNAGAAYVFTRGPSGWAQQAYLKASNTSYGNEFGYSVAISADTIVVGARQEDSDATGVNGSQNNNRAAAAGAAYVFSRTSGVWVQEAFLKASNTGAYDLFGTSVAISGDTIVVGASDEDGGSTGINGNQSDNSKAQAGAAYVFVRNAGGWSQQAYLKSGHPELSGRFGLAVSISADVVAAGETGDDSPATGTGGNPAATGAANSGAVWTFRRSGEEWSQLAYIKAGNTDTNDYFGTSCSLCADRLLAGAELEFSANSNPADNSLMGAGSAYVFSLAVPLTPLQQWRRDSFGICENAGAAADLSDPDGDGLTNLVEFAFGPDPKANTAAGLLPRWTLNGDGARVEFTAPGNALGVIYSAEYTPDLNAPAWTPVPDSGTGAVHRFVMPPASSELRRFFRLRVSIP